MLSLILAAQLGIVDLRYIAIKNLFLGCLTEFGGFICKLFWNYDSVDVISTQAIHYLLLTVVNVR